MDAAMTLALMPAGFAACVLFSAPAGLFAQWPSYPTAGVPKTADGKPDLAGPTPRTADGKPDLSGVWLYQRPPGTPAARATTTRMRRRIAI